jgi:hypothetical protein
MAAARDIIWIASYPKSGNTWLRFLVCNLLYGRQDSAEGLNLLAPDIHEMGAERLGAHAGLVKTHWAFTNEMPMAARTAAVIYVVRHPADVLVSNYHYASRSAGVADASREALERYAERFIQSRGDPRWATLGMGTWEGNVRSWLGQKHAFPVLPVRYEDMSSDPIKVCAALARLLKPNSSTLEIDAAVAHSAFDRMRELEAADIRERRIGIFYKPYLERAIDSGRRFMRSGRVGEGSRLLAPEQWRRLNEVFAPLLRELRYRDA